MTLVVLLQILSTVMLLGGTGLALYGFKLAYARRAEEVWPRSFMVQLLRPLTLGVLLVMGAMFLVTTEDDAFSGVFRVMTYISGVITVFLAALWQMAAVTDKKEKKREQE